MISIETCEEILNQKGAGYTKEEINQIREHLTKVAKIAIKSYDKDLTIKKDEKL